ncbi:MAG: ornithine carbamoyltransferase [Bacteroidota bacterium]|nr:ornithine carbamoyltransferase [Bacteroidota bacterium]
MKKDFLSIADWSTDELFELIDLSKKIKKNPEDYRQALQGKSVATIFEKQSLRTHVTFDVGIYQLGAHPIYLTQADISLGKRESVYDTGKNLERWVEGIVVRTYAHKTCTDLAKSVKVPVINALTDFEHPCQALGDFLTVHEKMWSFSGKKFVFVGDGNNVCNSLMLFASKVGMNFVACTPKGYEPDKNVFKAASAAAKKMSSTVQIINDPKEAVKHADVIYTDVWASMGQEAEKEERMKNFKSYQVNKKLFSLAKSDAIFMHCLPAHRGEEVTNDVIDSKNSVVFDEAENRLHTQKAVMVKLMKEV